MNIMPEPGVEKPIIHCAGLNEGGGLKSPDERLRRGGLSLQLRLNVR
jgi:hypothetical protein